MKKLLFLTSLIICAKANAGGTGSGGTPPSLRDGMIELADAAFRLDALQKIYVDDDTFRRTNARLSEAKAKPVSLDIDGSSFQIKKLRNRIVTEDLTKELLPTQK